jgi:hypothetical protein
VPVLPSPFSATPDPDANTAYVESLYKAVLDRVANPAEVAGWTSMLGSGMTKSQVATAFVNSSEHRQDEVNAYYLDFLHRPADSASSLFVNQLLAGAPESAVVQEFLNAPEYQSAHTTSASFVQGLYTDVLGRVGDTPGVNSWVAALNAGATRAQVIADFVLSAEASQQQVTSFYQAYLHRAPEGGASLNSWVTYLETTNGSAGGVEAAFLASPEFIADTKLPNG